MKKANTPSSLTSRFFLRHSVIPSDLSVDASFEIQESVENEIFHQLTRVFRCQIGQKVILINKLDLPPISQQQLEYLFEISVLGKKSLTLKLISIKKLAPVLPHALHLALCLPNKPAKLDFLLEKSTELGITSITLIRSAFSQFPHQLKPDRLDKIVTEAAEQSEQPTTPKIIIEKSLENFIRNKPLNCLVALERAPEAQSLLDLQLTGDTTILIGPEGGFSPAERDLIVTSDLRAFHLGASILKMETAALLALGIAALKLQR